MLAPVESSFGSPKKQNGRETNLAFLISAPISKLKEYRKEKSMSSHSLGAFNF